MTPVVFAGCFGWVHRGHGTKGVVLCGSFGHENMNAHQGWVELARRLSGRGFHVLRFDYPGSGDSSGSETDPNRVAAWQDSIAAAVGLLRTVTDTEDVILIGLRLGATLALQASRGIDRVEGVACLAPVLSGRRYVRELRLLANAWRDANLLPADEHPGSHLDVIGERLTADTLRELSGIDLRTLQPQTRAVLLMHEGETQQIADLARHLEAGGCSVSIAPFPGATDYIQDSLSSDMPDEAFRNLVDWCDRFRDEAGGSAGLSPLQPPLDSVMRLPNVTERAFQFGPGQELFGILCSPDTNHLRTTATVIMLNTGYGRHVGDGRVFVTLARQLAAMGVASLRMDLAGFGDSTGDADTSPEPYTSSATGDVVAAVDALQQAGFENPFVIGSCSGAYTAFHSALAEPRIRGLILINLQKFIWKTGSSFKVENRQTRRPLGFYVQAALQRRAWRRLMTGNVAVGAILMSICRRPISSVWRELSPLVEAATKRPTRYGQIMRWFRLLNSREVEVFMLYSDGDPGLSELADFFRKDRSRLRSLQHIHVDTLAKADHALLDYTARSQFVDMACGVIQRQRLGEKDQVPSRSDTQCG